MLYSWNQYINIVYPNENYPIVLAPHEKKLDSIHERSSPRFKDKLWFKRKQRLQMLFSRNQRINIVYPNKNYPFVLAPYEKKLDSIHGQSSSHFMDKLWFQTKWRLQMFFSWNHHINIVSPNENYPFFLSPHEKKLDSIHGWCLSRLKNKLWFQTKQGYKYFFHEPTHQYHLPNENNPFV